MSEVVEKIKVMKETSQEAVKSQVQATSTADVAQTNSSTQNQTDKPKPAPVKKAVKKQPETFGGFKKGFMFGPKKPAKAKSAASKPVKKDDVPFIRPKAASNAAPQYQIPEVQEAMNAGQALSQNTEWVTDDLLKNVTNNPTLWKRLSDPRFMQAMTEFQTNPNAAWEKYADNPEMQTFLKEFCSLMGNHFSQLEGSPFESSSPAASSPSQKKDDDIIRPSSDSQNTSVRSNAPDIQIHSKQGADIKVHNPQLSDSDEARMKEILADPEICGILMEGPVQRFIEVLRNEPEKGQRLLKDADPEMQAKIRKLVGAGLLQFER